MEACTGFWTGIASFTAAFFVTDKGRQLTNPPCWKLALVYWGAGLTALLWVLAIQKGHADNLAFWKYYMDKAAGSASVPNPRTVPPRMIAIHSGCDLGGG